MRKKILFFLFFFYPFFIFAETLPEYSVEQVYHYRIEGMIHTGTFEILDDLFEKARQEKKDLIFLEIDTPGGLLQSTEEIVKLFLNSELPIVVYVSPSGAKAGSAGTFITMAAHIAAMAPGTYIGAATPVMMGSSPETENPDMNKKIKSATSSFIESIAKQRNRNVEWGKKAVLEGDSITEDQALEKNVIDYVARSQKDLFTQMNGKEVKVLDKVYTFSILEPEVKVYQPDFKFKVLNVLASPELMYVLLLVVLAGAYLEFSNPGLIFPGSAAAVSLLLLLFANRALPIDILGILLIVLALVFLILEIYITSYGILSIAGIASFIFGSLFLFEDQAVTVPIPYIVGSSLALALISFGVGFVLVKSLRRKQQGGSEEMTALRFPVKEKIVAGEKKQLFLHSEYWRVISEDNLEVGDEAEVIRREGLTLILRKKER